MKNTLIATSMLVFSQSSFALNLLETYELAKSADPNWRAKTLQYDVDQLNIGVAKGNLLPSITVSGNVTRKNQDLKPSQGNTLFDTSNLISASSTSKQIAITARQPIFRMDAWEGYKQVKTSVQLSEVTLQLQQQQHILEVADAYFNVLRQQALTKTNEQEEKALFAQLNMMRAKQEEGLVAQSDVSEAYAQYQNARANRIATGVQLVLAKEQLTQIVGSYQGELAPLREDFQYQKPVPSSLEAWTALSRTKSLEIQQARLQQQYAGDALRVEKAARYPKVEAVASYGYNEQSPKTALSTDGQFDQVGLEMNWNVFSGGIIKNNIKKAVKTVEKSDVELEATIRKALTNTKKTYLQVDLDQATIEARKAAMESSALVAQASKAQYDEGLKNMVDVLLAQRNAFATKLEFVNAQYDYVLNALKLKASVGQLNESELKLMNSWLIDE